MTPRALAALHARAFTVPRPFTEAEFADLLSLDAVFVCTVDHGFALGRVIAGEAELLTIAVDPEHQGQGLGRGLLQAVLSEAARRGATELLLEVDEVNQGAVALYQRAGFTEVGRRPRYYRHPDGRQTDARVMRKAL